MERKSGRGRRDLHVKVKTARGRRLSSTRWLERQLNDPYVHRAKAEGYRGRAAYKIAEIDDKFGFLIPGAQVVDLGAAPGGWSQIAIKRTNALGTVPNQPKGRVLGVDLKAVEPLAGAQFLELDFLEADADAAVCKALSGPADVVLSDMAAAASGHRQTDHLRIIALAEAAAHFAMSVLSPGGCFVCKVLAGGTEANLLATLKQNFTKTAHFKPPASRSDSAEKFLIALGFTPKNKGSL